MQVNKRGGARKGAGRKNQGKILMTYRLAPDVVEFLRSQKRPASQLIEEAVRTAYINEQLEQKTKNNQT